MYSLNFAGAGGAGQKVILASTITVTRPCTYSFWLKLNAPTADYGNIIGFNNSSAIFIRGSGGAQNRKVDFANSADQLSAAISDATWHHIACTIAGGGGSGNLNIYVDGTLDAGSPVASQSALNLAAWGSDSSAEVYKGKLADIRVFSAELTAGNITTLAAGTNYTTGLTNRWAMTEGSGTTVADGTGGITGTINDATNITWDTDLPTQLSATGLLNRRRRMMAQL